MMKNKSYKTKKIVIIFLLILGIVMPTKTQLKKYRQRRDFTHTSEPAGGAKIKKKKSKLCFVIQKHDATHLHYDFRLEIDGVLKSWAVPKGPSTNPRQKRLAIPTDDHPLEYAKFEGVIPEGEYGAGTVLIWDKGTFENIKKKNGRLVSLKQCYKNGQIEVFLRGEKLYGGYALIRTSARGDERWLLIKMRDEYANARRNPVSSQQRSVKSGRTLKQIEKDT